MFLRDVRENIIEYAVSRELDLGPAVTSASLSTTTGSGCSWGLNEIESPFHVGRQMIRLDKDTEAGF